MKKTLCTIILFLFVSGCVAGGVNSYKKTNDLQPGMSTGDVVSVLGDPKKKQFVNGKWIWKYYFHEAWKGNVPYYLSFDPETDKLIEWKEDNKEWARDQNTWIHAFDSIK